MKIIGLSSLCCGDGVKTMNLDKISQSDRENDRIYLCLKCKKPAEAFFKALMTGPEIANIFGKD